MNIDRYDIEAGRNVLNRLRDTSPGDYQILMTKLKTNAGMNGALGQTEAVSMPSTEENTPGFWSRIFEVGTNALTTITDYKLREQQAGFESEARQRDYEEAAAAEMERQALLAARAQSQSMEYANQMEFLRQKQELDRAAASAKTRLNWALIAAVALGGVLVFSMVTR